VPDGKICKANFAIAALAFALGGCSSEGTFSVSDLNALKGEDPLRQADYNYFYKQGPARVTTGPVAAADLVGPDGRCAFAPAPAVVPAGPEPVAPAPAQAGPPPADPINPGSNRALYFTAGPEANRAVAGAPAGSLPPEVRSGPMGIAISMTECQVIGIAGYTDRVEIGVNERGERTATLTYPAGAHGGIYRFRSGRLASMERVAEAAPQPRKPAKSAKKQNAR